MAKYLLENVHAAYPDAKLALVVTSRGSMIRDLLASAPYIEVIEANRRDTSTLQHLWSRYHASDFVVTQYAGKHGGRFGMGAKLAARVLARCGRLVGFVDASPWNRSLFDHLLPVRPDQAVAEHERAALRAAGLPVGIPFPRLSLVAAPEVLTKFSLQPQSYIIAHFFAGNASRSVSPQKAREIVEALRVRFPDTRILLSGSQADRATAETIADGILGATVIAGDASLQEMMQLVYASFGVVSVDTGIAHITAQLQKPLVVMRTCLGPNWWFPEQYGSVVPQFSREDLCTPHVSKHYPDCINLVDAREVVSALRG